MSSMKNFYSGLPDTKPKNKQQANDSKLMKSLLSLFGGFKSIGL